MSQWLIPALVGGIPGLAFLIGTYLSLRGQTWDDEHPEDHW